jgi:hypothetical protein
MVTLHIDNCKPDGQVAQYLWVTVLDPEYKKGNSEEKIYLFI